MNDDVSQYIENADGSQMAVMQKIRQLIHETVPNVIEEIKWSRPVFKASKDFAYLKTAKGYVTLGFFNFDKLNDPQHKLEGTGKDMRHIKIKSVADIDEALLRDWFTSAANN